VYQWFDSLARGSLASIVMGALLCAQNFNAFCLFIGRNFRSASAKPVATPT
jgi:hypothetical protein